MPPLAAFLLALSLMFGNPLAHADSLRERVAERVQEKLGEPGLNGYPAHNRPSASLNYGRAPAQQFDIYTSRRHKNAPVIFMVHGGGWRYGDKRSSSVVDHKFERWGPRGFVLLSSNYRLLPELNPYQQAEDVARALAKAQAEAIHFGGDPHRFVLMGHSAGAHLVALLAASPALLREHGAHPPLGSIVLDSAALNVMEIMQRPHLTLYDEAFGKDAAFWAKASPWHALTQKPAPMLMVCSSRRVDACPQARSLADKVSQLGGKSSVLPVDMSHADINKDLGLAGSYTQAVEDFMRKLEPALSERLH